MNILKLRNFLALTLTLGLFNFEIFAQDSDDDSKKCCYSRILNDEFASSSPVTIISDEDILMAVMLVLTNFLSTRLPSQVISLVRLPTMVGWIKKG